MFKADGVAPITGVKVTAIRLRSEKQYTGDPTFKGGRYLVDGLPAGNYDVVIEASRSVFVVDQILDLNPSEGVTRSSSIQSQRPADRVIARTPPPKGSATVVGGTEAQATFWTATGGKVLIAVLSAGAAAALINNGHEHRGSPSTP